MYINNNAECLHTKIVPLES